MPDIFTTEKRSEVMSRIRGRGNKGTEIALATLFRSFKKEGGVESGTRTINRRKIEWRFRAWKDLVPAFESKLVTDLLDSLALFNLPHLTTRILRNMENAPSTSPAAQMFKTLDEACHDVKLTIGDNADWHVEVEPSGSFFGVKVHRGAKSFSELNEVAVAKNELAWFGFEEIQDNGQKVHRRSLWIYASEGRVKKTERFLKGRGLVPTVEKSFVMLSPGTTQIDDISWFKSILKALQDGDTR
jgi:hypothetical protein